MLFFSKLFCISIGVFFFYYFAGYFNYLWGVTELEFRNRIGFMLAGGLSGYLFSPYLNLFLLKAHTEIEKFLKTISIPNFISGILGLIIGLILANLITLPVHLFLKEFYKVGLFLSLTSCLVFGYLGFFISSKIPLFNNKTNFLKNEFLSPKIIDTSALIDGRIFELFSNSFLEGKIVIPDFVLDELQNICNDHDANRRKRGRKGLEVISKMKSINPNNLEIFDSTNNKLNRSGSVDTDLLNLTKLLKGTLITNDYALSKLCKINNIKSLNILELIKLLRPVLMPGDKLTVEIVKTGEHVGQGIAYLEDGTMIVVDGGEKFCGNKTEILITHMLQTSAGILVFAKALENQTDSNYTSI